MKFSLSRTKVDMVGGPIFKGILQVAVPIMIMNIMQILFNAADIAVLGILVNDTAVAAVGTNGALINLITGLFIGMAAGVNVVVARNIGKKDQSAVERTIGTSLLFALVGGLFILITGNIFAKVFLTWMNCDPNVIDLAAKYLRIYFLGMPIMFVYNFCAQILRAKGDSIRPLIYIMIGGVVNVILNVVFVVVFDTDVEGVAIATIIAQLISAVLSVIELLNDKEGVSLKLKHLRFYKRELIEVLKVGVPSGIQSSLFALSNVLIQSSVNAMGESAMTGISIANQYDGVIYNICNAPALAMLSFVSQNYGANNPERVKKSIYASISMSLLFGFSMGLVFCIFSSPLCYIMTNSAEVVRLAQSKLIPLCSTYFLCGIMEALSFSLRGLGKSLLSMIITLVFSCFVRILWVILIFPLNRTVFFLSIIWPITWVLTIICFIPFLVKTFKAFKKKASEELAIKQEN